MVLTLFRKLPLVLSLEADEVLSAVVALSTCLNRPIPRWHRMLGHATLYVPGTDHAGIATQSVVEKKLKKDHNITRHDLGREEFVKV